MGILYTVQGKADQETSKGKRGLKSPYISAMDLHSAMGLLGPTLAKCLAQV